MAKAKWRKRWEMNLLDGKMTYKALNIKMGIQGGEITLLNDIPRGSNIRQLVKAFNECDMVYQNRITFYNLARIDNTEERVKKMMRWYGLKEAVFIPSEMKNRYIMKGVEPTDKNLNLSDDIYWMCKDLGVLEEQEGNGAIVVFETFDRWRDLLVTEEPEEKAG